MIWNDNLLTSTDKINGYSLKMQLWRSGVTCDSNDHEMFPLPNKWQDINNAVLCATIVKHLNTLWRKDFIYFSLACLKCPDWYRDPSSWESAVGKDTTFQEQVEVAELAKDQSLQLCFANLHLDRFRLAAALHYPCWPTKLFQCCSHFPHSQHICVTWDFQAWLL